MFFEGSARRDGFPPRTGSGERALIAARAPTTLFSLAFCFQRFRTCSEDLGRDEARAKPKVLHVTPEKADGKVTVASVLKTLPGNDFRPSQAPSQYKRTRHRNALGVLKFHYAADQP